MVIENYKKEYKYEVLDGFAVQSCLNDLRQWWVVYGPRNATAEFSFKIAMEGIEAEFETVDDMAHQDIRKAEEELDEVLQNASSKLKSKLENQVEDLKRSVKAEQRRIEIQKQEADGFKKDLSDSERDLKVISQQLEMARSEMFELRAKNESLEREVLGGGGW